MQKRETLYLAVEHNTKYLTTLALAADKRAVLSDAENSEMKEKIKNFKKTQEENERQIKLMQKDSAQLVNERQRSTELTLELTKSKEKEEALLGTIKQQKADLAKVTEERDKLARSLKKADQEVKDLTEKVENLTRDYTQAKARLDVSESTQGQSGQVADEYRNMVT